MAVKILVGNDVDEFTPCCGAAYSADSMGTLYCKACFNPVDVSELVPNPNYKKPAKCAAKKVPAKKKAATTKHNVVTIQKNDKGRTVGRWVETYDDAQTAHDAIIEYIESFKGLDGHVVGERVPLRGRTADPAQKTAHIKTPDGSSISLSIIPETKRTPLRKESELSE